MNLCETKPAKYEFVKWTGDNLEECVNFTNKCSYLYDDDNEILNVQYKYNLNWQKCHKGDYILKTFNGYYRVIKGKEFDRIYKIID